MKHAYLIIAHNEPNILKTLLLMLDDERNVTILFSALTRMFPKPTFAP